MVAPRTVRDVAFVEGVRTPFGKAGPQGQYAETRADDMVVAVIRELLRRHPQLPPERIDEVAIAATTQTGDQGLTIGRSAALLAGLPASVPGFAIDRMCAGAMTAVTTVGSGSAEQGWGLAGRDEPPRPGTTVEALATLKTPFRPHGRVTAGNAAGLNDGATGCIMA